MKEVVYHTIQPVFDKDSEILILGSFPSVKSREEGFFYGNPQNRFWKVLSYVYESPLPSNIEEKKELLRRSRIALWDVIASCTIEGSSDSSIENAVPNDIESLVKNTGIKKIFLNGTTAKKYFNKYMTFDLTDKAFLLPSTSPANAAWTRERLCEVWKAALRP